MFKRPHLRATKRLVNASPALALLFLITACGKSPEPSEPEAPTLTPEVTTAPSKAALSLPAVWQTDDLGAPISSVAVAGEVGSMIAVTFEDGGLQFLNLEGERVTDKAAFNAAQVADGRYLLLQDTPVTIFPGLTRQGDMTLFIHGGAMTEPLDYPLDAGTDEKIVGICSSSPSIASDGVMRIGFWTEDSPRSLRSGRLVEVSDNLVLLLDEPVQADQNITACLLNETGAVVYSDPVIAATDLQFRSHTYTLTLDRAAGYTLTTKDRIITPFDVYDGITVRQPRRPVDMAGTGDARGGGYSGGVVILGGQTPNGDHSVTYVDPSQITLEPFGYQAPSASE